MIKKPVALLFNLPQPSVPVFLRSSKTRCVVPSTTTTTTTMTTTNTDSHNHPASSKSSLIVSNKDDDDDGFNTSTSRFGGGGDESSSLWRKSPFNFPIRRIYCVGRNYLDHVMEMKTMVPTTTTTTTTTDDNNNNVTTKSTSIIKEEKEEAPFFFHKPSDAIRVCYNPNKKYTEEEQTTANTHDCNPGVTTVVPYPTMTSSLQHEGEFIVAIGKDGMHNNNIIPPESAEEYIYGYAIGCDLTRRDLQTQAKLGRKPWDASKGFDSSCPISPIIPKEELGTTFFPSSTTTTTTTTSSFLENIHNYTLTLKVNNTVRQQSNLGKMIHSIPEIISHLSRLYQLRRGDIILTGTPAGVSDLSVGDVVSITCGDLIPCEFVIGPTSSSSSSLEEFQS